MCNLFQVKVCYLCVIFCAGQIYDTGHQHHGQQYPQQQHYTYQVPNAEASQNSHMIPGVQYHTDSNYFGPAAAAAPSILAFDVPVTTCGVPPLQGSSDGVQPYINAPTAAQQLAQAQPFVSTPTVNTNSLLPDQVNVAPSTAVSATRGTFFYILCIISLNRRNITSLSF